MCIGSNIRSTLGHCRTVHRSTEGKPNRYSSHIDEILHNSSNEIFHIFAICNSSISLTQFQKMLLEMMIAHDL